VVSSGRPDTPTISARRARTLLRYDFKGMAFITVSGEPGCRHEELARLAAQRLECELVTEPELAKMIAAEFGDSIRIPDLAWRPLTVSILASLGAERHVVVSSTGAELLSRELAAMLRLHVVAPESVRLANLMQDCRLNRAEAKGRLREMEAARAFVRKRRFGQKISRPTDFDLVLNSSRLGPSEMVDLLEAAVKSQGLLDSGALGAAAAAEVQFRVRLQLARFGIVAPKSPSIERDEVEFGRHFGHPSEQVFANLLDFYGIAWDYEPRSFPLQWDKDGKVSEAFTPDFYLPEFNLYVELTTMKQANVTRKNRKIRLLRAIYPHVNIQVFYQKDVQDLVTKYGLPERLAR
jgi:cytidylate kinase